ncbi:hypothetical protein CAPTEDRAFT_203228 [Capitella teleta]|uniref:Peptidase M12A domain-containing protein n=1 Tax=Capitella teleta TaxID=283909 RepID=R7TSK9_CAPTE|nr:hypothetical protein CAPTEDRAFT_203228 [Capitella teleta]|eukprot:ELT96863.1 hypothetical protein CAPTEDRAFT_203228 [Capitella teleta]
MEFNFQQHPSPVYSYGVPYGYSNVMHYEPYEEIGSRMGHSFSDIKLANLMYGCTQIIAESRSAQLEDSSPKTANATVLGTLSACVATRTVAPRETRHARFQSISSARHLPRRPSYPLSVSIVSTLLTTQSS